MFLRKPFISVSAMKKAVEQRQIWNKLLLFSCFFHLAAIIMPDRPAA